MSHRIVVALGAFGFVVLGAGRAVAQEVMIDVSGPVVSAEAYHVAVVCDWDGDGVEDLAIGAPGDWTTGIWNGACRIHSGRDGSVLTTFYGPSDNDGLGRAVARLSDVDNDGIDDLAVAAMAVNSVPLLTGSVYIYAGRTGTFLRRVDGPAANTNFGGRLGGIGDVDGDGVGDFYAGSIINGFFDRVDVVSGADGHSITTLNGTGTESFGTCIAALDDLDGDGARDLLIGAPGHLDGIRNVTGAAFVYSSASGALLLEHPGRHVYDNFGWSVAALGDVDGDGVSDYAIDNLKPSDSTVIVHVFSAASGAEIARIGAPSKELPFWHGIGNPGDVNGDGVPDIAVAGHWFDYGGWTHGATYLVSGKTFMHLHRMELLGAQVQPASFGDFDGDGRADVVVGDYDMAGYQFGEVVVYRGNDLWLTATPSTPLAGAALTLETREGVPGAPLVFVLVDVDGTSTFQVLGSVTTFDPLFGRKAQATVPAGLSGHHIGIRSYAHDAAGRLIDTAIASVDFQ